MCWDSKGLVRSGVSAQVTDGETFRRGAPQGQRND